MKHRAGGDRAEDNPQVQLHAYAFGLFQKSVLLTAEIAVIGDRPVTRVRLGMPRALAMPSHTGPTD